MANVLTDLAADIYAARQVIGREKIGAIQSVIVNSSDSERVALNDIVRSSFTPEPTLNTTYAPSMTIPEGDDQTIDNKTLTLDKVANVRIPWTGEDVRHVNNGAGYETIVGNQIEQAFRKIANQVEADLMDALKDGAGNAVGTSGTVPFASNFDLIADALKLLEDRGMPMAVNDVNLAMGNDAAANLRKLDNLFQVNTAGGDEMLRQGLLGELYGVGLKQSAGVAAHVKGTASGYLVDNAAGYAIGDKDIELDTGTGTILAGDIITFAADDERYVVGTGIAAPGQISLNSGLVEAIADDEAVALQDDYIGHMMFHRRAAELVFRPPQLPVGGDAAVDSMTVQDPVSGLIFEIRMYKGYNKAMIDISCLYGLKVWNPDFVCTLQG